MIKRVRFSISIKSKRAPALLLILCSLMISCYEDVMILDLSDFGPQIVIEGILTDQLLAHSVKISKTGDYEEPDVYPPVTDALVAIGDNEGNVETLRQSDAGVYLANSIQGVPGRTYTLTVTVAGKVYSASSTMPEALELDSVHVVSQQESSGLFVIYFTDREGVEDYCRINIYRNERWVEDYFYNGRFSDGEQIVLDKLYKNYSRGDIIRIDFLAIDKQTYEYLTLLYEEIYQDRDGIPEFMNLTLFNPSSNLSQDALGYFSAMAVRSDTLTVE